MNNKISVNKKFFWSLLFGFIFIFLLLILYIIAVKHGENEVAKLEKKIAVLNADILNLQNDSSRLQKEKADITRDSDRLNSLFQGKLNEIYPNLKKISSGKNEVNDRYLKSFEIDNGKIKTYMKNDLAKSKISPNFKILFLSKFGFITCDFYKAWLIQTISPEESRIDEDSINFKFGYPEYYTIIFN